MALTLQEQELFDFAVGALPQWVRTEDEFLAATAKMMGLVRTQIDYLFGQALITTATGATSTTPDWLAQHARDRSTSRQASETDPALQERLRVVPDALTRQAVLDAANAILAAAGVSGEAALLELPRDGAWLGDYTPLTGTGGTFTTGPVTFTPAVLPWAAQPWISPGVFPGRRARVDMSGAAAGGNDGTYEITGLVGDAVAYTNASAVAGVDATIAWVVQRTDALGNGTDGKARAYCGRGWRCATNRPLKILVILPFGTSAGTAASVEESIRVKKAAGFKLLVERRQSP